MVNSQLILVLGQCFTRLIPCQASRHSLAAVGANPYCPHANYGYSTPPNECRPERQVAALAGVVLSAKTFSVDK